MEICNKILHSYAIYCREALVKIFKCYLILKKSYDTLSKGATFFGQPCNFKIKIGSNALTKLQSKNLWKSPTAIINRPMRLQLIICHTKSSFIRFCYKTRANTQQVLPVQTGLYRYDI